MIVIHTPKFHFFGLLIFSTLISACLKPEDYPAEPRITFNRIDFDAANNATLYINFIDGDGNFGLDEGDYEDLPDACIKSYNLYVKQFELQSGTWVNITPDPCLSENNLPLFYRVPWVKPTGQIQTQKGEIKVDLKDYWYTTVVSPHDTIRFEISIADRDFNISNVISTGNYLKP